jgi:anti-sigma-K factor RskA
MNELYELYALGTLEPELAAEIERHLADQCEYCWGRLQEATVLAAAMAGIAEPKTPSKSLRQRVLAIGGGTQRSRGWLFAVVGLSAACAVLLAFSIWSGGQVHALEDRMNGLTRERNELRSALEILSRSDTRTVQFGRADTPHGRVFVNRNRGLVFVGSQLPALATDRTYELWLVPTSGAPRPAGLFQPNARGDSVNVSPVPVNPAEIAAVAVSVEPRQGSSAPTTKPFLVVPLG